jgi:hypothetical protein
MKNEKDKEVWIALKDEMTERGSMLICKDENGNTMLCVYATLATGELKIVPFFGKEFAATHYQKIIK